MNNSANPELTTNETATELIGQVIIHYTALCTQEKKSPNPDWEAISQWEISLFNLGQERKASCLRSTQASMIKKAYTVYYPFLKSLRDS